MVEDVSLHEAQLISDLLAVVRNQLTQSGDALDHARVAALLLSVLRYVACCLCRISTFDSKSVELSVCTCVFWWCWLCRQGDRDRKAASELLKLAASRMSTAQVRSCPIRLTRIDINPWLTQCDPILAYLLNPSPAVRHGCVEVR